MEYNWLQHQRSDKNKEKPMNENTIDYASMAIVLLIWLLLDVRNRRATN
jgi:hypothetical protein